MEIKDETVVLRIKEVMKEKGFTSQASFGDAIKQPQSTISAVLSLTRGAAPVIDAMNQYLHLSKQWLLTGLGSKYETNIIKEAASKLPNMTNSERVELLKQLNELYARHQKLMEEAQDIMKTIVEIDKKILLSNSDIAE